MRYRRATLLLHPIFLLSLLLLLLNDSYLKYYFHNWFTGKLSDFAGLFAFAVFSFELRHNNKKAVTIVISLLFLWWKSPVSDSTISFFNCYMHIPLHRVIDYSDLLALIILPLTFFIKPITISNSFFTSLSKYCVAFISFTAFTATSLPRRLADDNKVLLDKHIKTKKNEGEILKTFKDNGLRPVSAPIYEKRGHYKYYLKPKNSKDLIPIDSLYSGLYHKIDYGSTYTIPELFIAEDSIYNLQILISDFSRKKSDIRLYSFEHKSLNDSNIYISSYYLWRKLKKPIKKKFKEMLR